ncbi:MAG: hypothetical protein ACREDU_01215, partial [Methylocella sp.]
MAVALLLNQPAKDKTPAPVATPAAALVAKARALLDDDPLITRSNVQLAEQLSLEAIAKDTTNAEAYAAAAWANFRFIAERYDDSASRRADLKNYAEKARLLAPDSVNAELAMCGVLRANNRQADGIARLAALAARVPDNFTVLREFAWAAAWGDGFDWGTGGKNEPEVLAKLAAFSPLGRAYADSIRASRHWVRGEYVEADRLLDGIFAGGQPVRLAYLNRLLVLAFGWGDLPAAQAFVAKIPAKLLLEDVFIRHVAYVWLYSGDYDKALATLDQSQREMLQEALINTPTALIRGDALAAAGRPNAAAIQWGEAVKVLDKL